MPDLCINFILYDRESWEELEDLSKDRKEKLRKSEECHKFCKDLTDALMQIKVLSSWQGCAVKILNMTVVLLTCHLSDRRGIRAFLMI